MTNQDHPAFSSFHFGIKGQTFDQVFKFLSWDVARVNPEITAIDLHERLDSAYKNNTAGFGEGIALFDWKQEVAKPVLTLARLLTPVPFLSPDDVPVDIIVTLITPEHQGSQHLTHLARLSRLLRDKDTLERIRSVESADGLASVLRYAAPSQLAA